MCVRAAVSAACRDSDRATMCAATSDKPQLSSARHNGISFVKSFIGTNSESSSPLLAPESAYDAHDQSCIVSELVRVGLEQGAELRAAYRRAEVVEAFFEV